MRKTKLRVLIITLNAWCNSENDRSILMQHTGLKDKNGKKIIGGDILQGDIGNKKYLGEIIVIEFLDGGIFPFSNMNDDNLPYPKPNKCEIIGNIYENPELLKQ